jgi:putative ABC transport system substrate-binding protein
MRRREFFGVVVAGIAGLPRAVAGQQSAMPIIGVLSGGSLEGYANHTAAFRQGLKEAGFVPGENVSIEYRWANGRYENLPVLATDLLGRKVSVLFASGGQLAVKAARLATSSTPIVFTSGGDPVDAGLDVSLSRPEGNLTGVSFSGRALGPKRLELIRELVPKAATIAVLQNPQNPLRPVELEGLQKAAAALGQKLRLYSASTISEIDQAFVELGQSRPDALVLNGDLFFTSQRELFAALASRHRIPAIYHEDSFVKSGGLVSYGANTLAAYHQAGVYTGRILNGAKPADLPVLLPTKFEVVLNLKVAKALGLNVPESFLLFRTDAVIE